MEGFPAPSTVIDESKPPLSTLAVFQSPGWSQLPWVLADISQIAYFSIPALW